MLPDCIEWTKSRDTWGYGVRWDKHQKRSRLAHIMAYEEEYGPVPEGKVVMHCCDNRACINPLHLSTGTQKENMQDASRKGRIGGPKKKLTDEQVLDIKRLKATHTYKQLSELFDVPIGTIRKISTGRTRANLVCESV